MDTKPFKTSGTNIFCITLLRPQFNLFTIQELSCVLGNIQR